MKPNVNQVLAVTLFRATGFKRSSTPAGRDRRMRPIVGQPIVRAAGWPRFPI